jgi:peptidoglycan/xylan/chitin deacetylase (PgdA/CDA1 family)
MLRPLTVCLVALSVLGAGRADRLEGGRQATASAGATREVAITIDDLPSVSVLGSDFGQAERTTADLVSALSRHQIPAIGFVNERKLAPDGTLEPRRVALLQQWVDAGLELGNHSYSHPDLNTTSLEAYEADVVEGETITRRLMTSAGKSLRYFRHPFLHTGRTPELRRELAAFLTSRGYRVAPVTIDNSDYVFAAAFDRVSATGNSAGAERIAAAYIEYMDAVTAYYEQQAVAIVGRDIAQTLLIHANALNAATLDRLAARLEARRYRFVPLDRALRDAAYELRDTYVGPGGISWLHRWAITAGKPPALFRGEPVVPDWINSAAALR